MEFRQFLAVMLLATVFSWAAWFLVVLAISPASTSANGFVFFYLTFFLALFCTFTTLGSIIRVVTKKPDVVAKEVMLALRQGLFFSALITASIILLSFELLSWWLMLIMIALISVLELMFLSISEKQVKPEPDLNTKIDQE